MRLSSKAILAGTLLSFSPLCLADVYLGGSGTLTQYKYDDVSNGFGGQVFAGYRPLSIPMVFEVSYLKTGKSKVDNFNEDGVSGTNVSLAFQGETVSVGYYGRFDRKGSGAFAKLGYYTGKSKGTGNFNGTEFDNSENSNGVMFAFGVDWMLTRYFGFRADFGSLIGVKDLPQFGSDHTSNVTTANLGVVFSFGGEELPPRYTRRYAPVAPQPYTPPPAAPYAAPQMYAPVPTPVAPEPAPVVAAPVAQTYVVPAPAPQPAPSTKPQAFAVAGAVVRGSPSSKSAIATVLPRGATVHLSSQRIENAEGTWQLVSGDNIKGWVNEKELQLPAQ